MSILNLKKSQTLRMRLRILRYWGLDWPPYTVHLLSSGNSQQIRGTWVINMKAVHELKSTKPSTSTNIWAHCDWRRYKFIFAVQCTLQMFCLQNTQMLVCVLNSRRNIGCFYMYLSVTNNKYFHVVFTLNQTLNWLKNKDILPMVQKIFCWFNKLFSY